MLASQSVHDATFDAVEYCPAPHAVHELAPASEPVFVIDPAAQAMHDVTFDAVEYSPGAHAVHVIAPAEAPVFVNDPAAHSGQYDLPPSD